MICARCDKPIRQDEDALPVDRHSASAGGSTVYVHTYVCKRAPQQTYPSQRR